MLTSINTKLFLLINVAPNTSTMMIAITTFCAEYLIYTPLVAMLYYWFKKPNLRGLIVKIVITIMVSLIITAILRALIISPRPFELAIGTNFLMHSSSNSFPSKHATFIFAITFTVFYGLKDIHKQLALFISFLVLALLISGSRIYLGVHWPLDIFGGVVVGCCCAYLVNKQWVNIKYMLLQLCRLFPLTSNKLKTTKYITKAQIDD